MEKLIKNLDEYGLEKSSSYLTVDNKTIQKRIYDKDGKAKIDIDYYHAGDMEFPHKHTWENDIRLSTVPLEDGDDYEEDTLEYTFEDFKEDLVNGREMEFEFNGTGFSILNVPYENSKEGSVWYFSALSEVGVGLVICDFEDRENLINFVEGLELGGISLEHIINGELYENFYIM